MDNGASSYRRFCDEGDEGGLAEIIRDYRDGLILYLHSLVGDLTAAEDLAEDTFVLLGVKKPRDKGTASFKTWLYTIGRHRAVDYLRKRARSQEVPLEDFAQIISRSDSLELSYLKEEQRALLHASLCKLKAEYRQVLWLAYFEDLPYKEVAAILKTKPHNVETLVYRAKAALKSQLKADGFDDEKL